jgi:hypothetical protein
VPSAGRGYRPDDRVRRATNSDPDWERAVFLAGVDHGVVQQWAEFALPGHCLSGAELQKQIEFLCEQLVVVGQGVTEQRKRLGERAAADHQLGPPVRQQVESDEILEYAYRISRAEHDDSARQLDRFRAPGNGRKNDFRS